MNLTIIPDLLPHDHYTPAVCPISITKWYDDAINPCMYELLWASVLGTLVLLGLTVSLIASRAPIRLPPSWVSANFNI